MSTHADRSMNAERFSLTSDVLIRSHAVDTRRRKMIAADLPGASAPTLRAAGWPGEIFYRVGERRDESNDPNERADGRADGRGVDAWTCTKRILDAVDATG